MQFKNIKKVGLGIICFEGTEHLYNIISTLRESVGYVSVGLLRLSYHGDPMSNVDINEIFRLRDEDHLVDEIVEIELDTKKPAREQETDKRNLLIQDAEDHGCSHVIIIDSDEYYTKKSFEYALLQIDENDYEMTYCQYVNYYHDYMHYLKYPFEKGMYVPFVSKVKYRHEFECADFNLPSDPTRRYIRPFDRMIPARNPDGSITHVKHYTVDYHLFEWNEVKMHHLSWIRADIRKKLENWSSKLIFENYNDLIDKSVCTFKRFDENSADTQKAVMMFFTPDNKVDIATFPKQFIHPRADINTRLRPAKDYKKLLVLSMSALKEPFISLDKVSKETWMNIDKEKYPNIDADFWVYTDAEDGHPTSIDREKHIIYIQQDHKHEDMVMSTYSKTIETLYLIKNELKLEYDYIVRTNNSTWLNIPLINEFLAYQHDDSMIFGGKLYSAFHSAFNVYAGGQLMIFSKRDIDILLKINGSLESAKEYETKIVSADDNMLCGRLNERAIKLGLYYDDIYHSIGADDISGTEFDESDIDFFAAAYQVKTYDVSSDERIKYDSAKMRRIDELWREYDGTIDELYEGLMDNYYDAEIVVIPYSKKEWFGIEQKEVAKARLKCSKPRIEALKFLKEHQKKLGYYPANFI